MPFRDLRAFLSTLESAGELARVRRPVALKDEIGAICRSLLNRQGPAVLFECPGGIDIPVASDLLASRTRYALAMEAEPGCVTREWLRRSETPIPPRVVTDAPCKENILLGDAVDLTKLPVPIWNSLDGGPYITMGCHVSVDPVTGERNVGIYRNQVHDRYTVGVLCAGYTHLNLQRRKGDPGKPFPVAICIGLDPTIYMAAVAALPLGTDELALAGAVRGAPVDLVACETIPLHVPATAEIVLEGEILPDTLVEEGPFGEFAGYYGPAHPRDVIRIKAITHRNAPIFQATYEGRPPHESYYITSVPRQAQVLREVTLKGIRDVCFTIGGGGAFNAVVSIDQPYAGYAKQIAMAVLGSSPGRYVKNIIIVGADVDPADPIAVDWSLATRVQADRDIEILRNVTGIILDPSLSPAAKLSGKARTSKLIIDATEYDHDEYDPVCAPNPDVLKHVEAHWADYGLPA
jgi:UbiD family decarboxylase